MSTRLLAGLVDDAALFPPGNAPMPRAVAEHREHKLAGYAYLVNRFLCPASRLDEMSARIEEPTRITLGEYRVGVIADTGRAGVDAAVNQVRADRRMELDAIEIPLPADSDLAAEARATLAALPEMRAFVELPRSPGWQKALDVLADGNSGAKIRTGGLRAEAFPTPAELARFIVACVERTIPFKATAGLHHAVRHTAEATGFEHHGFLNILVATAAAVRKVAFAEVESVLEERDGAALVAAARAIDPDMAHSVRTLFTGYGSCDIHEPVTDLTELGLM